MSFIWLTLFKYQRSSNLRLALVYIRNFHQFEKVEWNKLVRGESLRTSNNKENALILNPLIKLGAFWMFTVLSCVRGFFLKVPHPCSSFLTSWSQDEAGFSETLECLRFVFDFVFLLALVFCITVQSCWIFSPLLLKVELLLTPAWESCVFLFILLIALRFHKEIAFAKVINNNNNNSNNNKNNKNKNIISISIINLQFPEYYSFLRIWMVSH